jgi:cell division protein FtsW (lipid II flippase)
MVVGLLPVTGIPLPFITYGGSSLLTNMMSLGIVMGISMLSKDRRRIARPRMTARL